MKKWILGFICIGLFSFSNAFAAPADYSLRIKAGPSFDLGDWHNQACIGGEFDYDFGYSLGFNLISMFGISDAFRYDIVPSVRANYLYLGPAYLYGVFGLGLGVYDSDSALDIRLGTGLTMPLGEQFEFNTDVNFFFAPAGTPGTPITLDWFIGFGFKFH